MNAIPAHDPLKTALSSYNPSRAYELIGSVKTTSESDLIQILDLAKKSQKTWQALGLNARQTILKNLRHVLTAHRQYLVEKTSLEMGMPLKLSENIVDGGFKNFLWCLDNAPKILRNKILFQNTKEVNIQTFEPYGVFACFLAWNFPFGNFVTSVIPPLLAGNTVIIKYSEEIPVFSSFLQQLIESSALFPKGVLNFVYGDATLGALLCKQKLDFISFTGSSSTGKNIYAAAAQNLTPVCLELGGSSPGIIFENTKLTQAHLRYIFWKRFANSGQFCDAIKRLIVHESLMDICIAKLSHLAREVVIGDALDPKTQIGPLVNENQVIKIESQIEDAVAKGAQIICGGQRSPFLKGAYFEPTLLTHITSEMRVWKEEVFGPVLPIMSFKTYDEAITLANATHHGLSASVYCDDDKILKRAFNDLKVGSIDDGIAQYHRPENPFGGFKHSGIGRQGGIIGFENICQTKIIAYKKNTFKDRIKKFISP